jgi:precorrin-6B methylase 2
MPATPSTLSREVSQLSAHEARELAQALANGEAVADVRFDRVFPNWARRVSPMHFTELHVVKRAVELLDPRRGDVVLDVGSGAGKFCLAGSLMTQAHFLGIEQRANLVDAANSAAALLGADRVTFSVKDALELDWRTFPMLYLFNPFEENVMPVGHRIDDVPAHSKQRYKKVVGTAAEKLAQMPRGTRVVTFHGMGAPMPDNYEMEHQSIIEVGTLELWVCRRSKVRAL